MKSLLLVVVLIFASSSFGQQKPEPLGKNPTKEQIRKKGKEVEAWLKTPAGQAETAQRKKDDAEFDRRFVKLFSKGIFSYLDRLGLNDHTARLGHYSLLRNSALDSAMRIHVATFNVVGNGDTYNKENCNLVADAMASKPGVVVRYWCEKGAFPSTD